jgi:hypothetical protein
VTQTTLAAANVPDLSVTLAGQGNGDGRPPHLATDVQMGVKCPVGFLLTQRDIWSNSDGVPTRSSMTSSLTSRSPADATAILIAALAE